MRVWVDLSNSPHVPLFAALRPELERAGYEVVLTARDHAQTVALAAHEWDDVEVIGGGSPGGRLGKARALVRRARELAAFARRRRPAVALSHGSYAQLVAARLAGVPAVTMMDYEHQPANHLSFRLARRVVVPEVFPERELRRAGGGAKAIRYAGFKEEAYLCSFEPDETGLSELRPSDGGLLVLMRPAPEGALYHRRSNPRFDEVLADAQRAGARVVVLPRSAAQAERYRALGAVVPARPVDARSLAAIADIVIGAGGTMNRESAILGTPTYTVFDGRLAAVDGELMRLGRLRDLRAPGATVAFRPTHDRTPLAGEPAIVGAALRAVDEASR